MKNGRPKKFRSDSGLFYRVIVLTSQDAIFVLSSMMDVEEDLILDKGLHLDEHLTQDEGYTGPHHDLWSIHIPDTETQVSRAARI